MPLPERPHLYLDEVAEHLGVSLRDIESYLMQGQLRASIWLLPTFVEMFIFELHHKGIYEPFDQRWHEGYVELSPVTCRKVLVAGQTEERCFFDNYPSIALRILPHHPAASLKRGQLVVSPLALHSFRTLHGLYKSEVDAMSSPGRPSIMPEILAEHQRRARLHIAFKTNSHEARALRNWAAARFTADTIPTQKTICNRLSELHQQWRKAAADERSNGNNHTKSVTVAA
ncbi:MAG: hypothetical protein ACK53X_09155 [Holosporales bacterium]|jgi:hypothetical protein